LQDSYGTITPSGLHYERHHNGIPNIDPARHRLLVHGMVDRPIKYSLTDLKRFPTVSRTYFLECSGNTFTEILQAQEPTVQRTHGLVSTSEWTGVPLSTLLKETGLKPQAAWVLAEGADAAVMTRSVPLDKCLSDALVVRRWNLEFLVENEGLLHAAGLARYADRLSLELRLVDGRLIHRTLKFAPKTALPTGQIAERVWSPAPWPEEAEKGWHAFDPRPTPLYLQDGARLFRVVRVPELQALFIQMRVHFDMNGETVADFRHKVDEEIDEYHPRHLIVDLRFDTGGDIDATRDWQRALPARIPGRVYVLVGRYTFSAGIVAAAAFKHDAPQQVRLVGEGVGDRLRWWSEGHNVCMPDSHYCLHLTTGLWDLVHGCAERAECYGDKYDARVVDLLPDLDAPLTPTSWLSGRDPGIDAIERDLGSTDRPRVMGGR